MQHLRFNQLRSICLITIMVGTLAACSTSAPPQQTPLETSQVPAEFPADYYKQASALGKKVLRVIPDRSLVSIEVRRGGTLARLGHDHVVASRDVTGYVALDEGRTDLYIPLIKLTVDEPELRAIAGFDTQPTPEAIEGTRKNMLVKVLEAERFPYVLIRATRTNPAASTLNVSITLHGVTRTFEVPAEIENLPNEIRVSGRMTFNQSDFGIVPFSILGGAMQVLDRLDLRFRIIASGS